MKYIVTEIQSGDSLGILNSNYDNRADAESNFYSVCSFAVKSSVPVHTVMLYTDEGFVIDLKCFKHEVVPEADPEPGSESSNG